MKNVKISYKIATLLFVIYFMVCFFMYRSNASSITDVYVTTKTDLIEKGEEIEVNINMKNNKTAAFTSYLYFDNTKLEYVSGPDNTRVIDNRIISVWYDELGGKGEKEGQIAKYKFKAKENGIANFVADGEFYTKEGQLLQTNFQESQLQIGKQESKLVQESQEKGISEQEEDANLQILRFDQEGMIPNFDKNIYEYYLTVPNEIKDLEVLYVTENPNAKVTVSGNTNLKEGLNKIKIQVVSENQKQTKNYSIEVTKTQDLQAANTNLEILAIEDAMLNPPFDNSITKYETEVSTQINNLNILAIPQNEKAKVEIQGKENLKEGHNHVNVIVTAKNGITKRQYDVDVYKRNEKEEKSYQEQQENNQNLLEQAYTIEETSAKIELDPQNEMQKNSRWILWSMLGIVSVITILVVIIFIRRKRK